MQFVNPCRVALVTGGACGVGFADAGDRASERGGWVTWHVVRMYGGFSMA